MSDYLELEFSSPAAAAPRMGIQILSDVRFLRECLAETLERHGEFVVLGCFAHIEEALSRAEADRPDVILLDETFPDGLNAVRRIREALPEILPVAIGVAETPIEVIAWGEAGIAGYLPRTCGVNDIFPLLSDISRGRQVCSTDVAAGLLRRLGALNAAQRETAPNGAILTTRELQIGEMIADGLSNKEIARRLNIGVATAKTHVHHIFAKLGVQGRGRAAYMMRERKRAFHKVLASASLNSGSSSAAEVRPFLHRSILCPQSD